MPKFSSPGIIKSEYNDLRESLLVANSENLQNLLQRIQEYVNGLMKTEFPKTNCGSIPDEWIDTIYKSGIGNLDHTKDFYIFRLAREAEGFNERARTPAESKNCKAGQYQAILHVTGIYFGQHQEHDFLAYLQVKVKQWTFERAPNTIPGVCIIPPIGQKMVQHNDDTSVTLDLPMKKKRTSDDQKRKPSTADMAKAWSKATPAYMPKENEGPSMYDADDDDMDSGDTDEVDEDV